MINLSNIQLVASGTNRACYAHPFESDKCIKINITNDLSETLKENNYYRYLKSKNTNWANISQHFGSIETNLGKGEVFELIKDYDNNISKTISFYLNSNHNNVFMDELIILLNNLKEYILNQNIIVKDLNTKNIVYQKINNTDSKLVIIDGLSNSKRFIFYSFCRYISRIIINKKWREFEKKLLKIYCLKL